MVFLASSWDWRYHPFRIQCKQTCSCGEKIRLIHLGVFKNGGTAKSSIFSHYKPSILGYPYFWKHPPGALSFFLYLHIEHAKSSWIPMIERRLRGPGALKNLTNCRTMRQSPYISTWDCLSIKFLCVMYFIYTIWHVHASKVLINFHTNLFPSRII